ncbi:sodium-dependent transporter [Prevotella sp. E9-3]|uniref:sodium-dependent transporter n=1 Tax=Prevotella sp. E9-3 TaxID=2913621 RepID=UPI001ED9E9C3|nr:sodium-dependent transporter [Prevotella sp. E9-3]UKK48316.1 sodium-dependent transporter [Prevotella sp. E9-3]
MKARGNFASKLGIILATAGSAVGLGNVWRFPFMAGHNGGAAFIVLYFGCILLLGIPGMVSEFIIGRHSQSNAARAYYEISGGQRRWRLVGYLGILTSTIILGFYAVVAGWCLQYLFASLMGHLSGDADYVLHYFQSFSSHPWKPVLWAVAFILITHLVIVRGVQNGIERASKLLMPLLLVLLVLIVIASCSLPGAMAGVEFLLKPDFSKVSGGVLLEALGQAFFSLSLGTACLCTYASYFSRDTNLLKSAGQIAFLDTFIAILSGLMIFPAAFSVGVEPDAGPSLIFITLPNVFQQAFGHLPLLGYVIGILFYALLVFAALTSTISMHEISTAFFAEELNLQRKKAAWIETLVCILLAIGCSLSVGAVDSLTLFGQSLMDFCDMLTAQIMLPLGAFLTSLFIGWVVDQRLVHDELTNQGTVAEGLFRAYQFSVRYIVPLCILLIFLHQFGVL